MFGNSGLAMGQPLKMSDDCFDQLRLIPRKRLAEGDVANLKAYQQRVTTAAGVDCLATRDMAFYRLIVVIRKHSRSYVRQEV